MPPYIFGPAARYALVLLDDSTGRRVAGPRFIAPREARRRYVLSADTLSLGVMELDGYGLVDAFTSCVGSDDLDFRRTRKSYRINRSGLATRLTRERIIELQRRAQDPTRQRDDMENARLFRGPEWGVWRKETEESEQAFPRSALVVERETIQPLNKSSTAS